MPDDDLPQPTPGRELAALRDSVGVRQEDLAHRIRVHRVTLSGWENEPSVDAIRSARYRRALRELAEEVIGETA